ncbi:MAG: hypothetical protein KAR35_05580 [Candidatus Heimdallarchaeota archaeon]|nr:hypothetical protein [Candidatus Heimdallarchaeota archaeon]MCK5048829.1 hypothetical protein [Candidatus Heimdallarchaeota archaeon]
MKLDSLLSRQSKFKAVSSLAIIIMFIGFVISCTIIAYLYITIYPCNTECGPCYGPYGRLEYRSSSNNSSLEIRIEYDVKCGDCNVSEVTVTNSTTSIPMDQIWWAGNDEPLSNEESVSYIFKRDQIAILHVSIEGGFKHGETYSVEIMYTSDGNTRYTSIDVTIYLLD